MQVRGYNSGGLIEAVIDDTVVIIPDDMGNPLRRRVAEWEDEGNTIPPYVPPAPTIPPLDRASFWLAALEVGVMKSDILAQINQIPDPIERERRRVLVEETRVYRREDPLVTALAQSEGITEEQLDALWAWASTI